MNTIKQTLINQRRSWNLRSKVPFEAFDATKNS